MDYKRLSEIYMKRHPATPRSLQDNDPRVSFLRRHLPDVATARILDAGCGTGEVARFLAGLGYRNIIGLDLFDRLDSNGTFEYRQGSVTDTKLPSRSLDFIYCLGVLNHVVHPEEAFREFRRLLRPGGALVFSAHTKYSLFTLERIIYRYFGFRRHLRGAGFMSFREYDQLLRKSGFNTIEIDGYRLFWAPMPVEKMYKKIIRVIKRDRPGSNRPHCYDHAKIIKLFRATAAYQVIMAAEASAI